MSKHRNNNRDSAARRKLLRGIVAGGGVAGAAGLTQWTRPVVESVTLPAHAATSVVTQSGGLARFSLTTAGGIGLRSPDEEDMLYARGGRSSLLDAIIPQAHAQQGGTAQNVLIEKPGGLYDYYLLDSTDSEDCIVSFLYTATNLSVGGSAELIYSPCFGEGSSDGNAVLNSVSETTAVVTIFGGSERTLDLDPSAGPLTLTPCPCVFNEPE